MSSRRVVYSTSDGDLRKARDPRERERLTAERSGGEGAARDRRKVRVRREVGGRRGKTVTTVTGVPVKNDELKLLAGRLKKRCGVGGAVKDGVIELQGDHREAVVELLRAEGFITVLAGG
ncbi:MAG: stress response translation initiation inhibitor YciH [Solirubrobacteraceae bacterium]